MENDRYDRYGPLLKWVALYWLEGFSNTLVLLPMLKYLLVGCNRAGEYRGTWWRRLRANGIDYMSDACKFFFLLHFCDIFTVFWARILGTQDWLVLEPLRLTQ